MTPRVSVVMAVYNGEDDLLMSAESILGQVGLSLELIIVDDGSRDDSFECAAAIASRDRRVRVLRREHRGLTPALIVGCAAARGELIARQDVGDRSLQDRLARQVKLLSERPQVVMTACGTRFLGPGGEDLLDSVFEGCELQRNLCADRPRGPSHHGAAMFRREAYESAGGYRASFLVAQDLDLWVRLAERGICWAEPEIGYEATWSLGSISHRLRVQQELAVDTICRSREFRAKGAGDAALLAAFEQDVRKARADLDSTIGSAERAAYYYFVGSLLIKRNRLAARGYLWKAVNTYPVHWRAWLKWALTGLSR
jgi:glycosyltransferase involved in cell wall biosynthesis